MLARIRKAMDEKDEGFTLIELLVVIIIIGILAAIAIPVFLNQRTKGYEAADKSDLKNAATAEETYLTDNDKYSTANADLTAVGFKGTNGVTLTVKSVRDTAGSTGSQNGSYCMMAVNSKGGATWYYDSAAGGVSKTVCS